MNITLTDQLLDASEKLKSKGKKLIGLRYIDESFYGNEEVVVFKIRQKNFKNAMEVLGKQMKQYPHAFQVFLNPLDELVVKQIKQIPMFYFN